MATLEQYVQSSPVFAGPSAADGATKTTRFMSAEAGPWVVAQPPESIPRPVAVDVAEYTAANQGRIHDGTCSAAPARREPGHLSLQLPGSDTPPIAVSRLLAAELVAAAKGGWSSAGPRFGDPEARRQLATLLGAIEDALSRPVSSRASAVAPVRAACSCPRGNGREPGLPRVQHGNVGELCGRSEVTKKVIAICAKKVPPCGGG